MKLMEIMKRRRSIREIDGSRDVSDDDIEKIIEAGLSAPSPRNTQCWKFFVVRNADVRRALATESGHQQCIADAPVVIVVTIDTLEVAAIFGKRGVDLYAVQGTAAAVENMLLMVTDLGLGSCWIGAFKEEEAIRILGLPPDIRPVAMLPIGYVKGDYPLQPKRKPIDALVKWVR